MRRTVTLLSAFLSVSILAACASEDASDQATSDDMEMAADEQLACYTRGPIADAMERPSPLRELEFSVGGHPALLCYGAPSARGREIMGGLLVYGQPERIGANEPTTIHLSGPATLGTVALAPGSYSIYAIAGENEWQFFVNSNWERWGIPIDDGVRAGDIGSFTATPETIDPMVETLTYRWEGMSGGTMGDMVMEWENTRLRFHVHPGG